MEYQSILFECTDDVQDKACSMPEFFSDLNLDQIIREVLAGKEEYSLNPYYYQSLRNIDAVNFRMEIMKEIETTELFDYIVTFSGKMKRIREYVGFSQEVHNLFQRKKWLLDAVNLYCGTLLDFHHSLDSMDLCSKGLRSFDSWLVKYLESAEFRVLYLDTQNVSDELSRIRYSLQIENGRVIIEPDNTGEDYCALIEKTFEQINEVKFDYHVRFFTELEMCALEKRILDIVMEMNPGAFTKLNEYFRKHADFFELAIKSFDREIQFYISYIEYIRKLRKKGFEFAYPLFSPAKRLNITGGYDLALANKNSGSGTGIVPNDFSLNGEERIFILTGPNQGGKTTFARAFGQILFLASIGCPVPCRKAEMFLFDTIYTHFSEEEIAGSNAGRLQEELARLKTILGSVSTNSIVIINELFATTTSFDAYTMGKRVLDHFITLDCICLYVTHIHELARISDRTVSLTADVQSEDNAVRTYKIIRKPADGCAYANSIVEKHKLTYNEIKERIRV